jgi:DHA2 family multidrug resistance protein
MVSIFVHDPSYIRQRLRAGHRIDYLGIIFLVLSLGLMQVILDRGQRADWFHASWVIWAAITSLLAIGLLILRELHFSEPILDLRILGIPIFSVAVTLVVVLSFVLWGTGALNPIFLPELMGYTAWKAGLVMCPRAFGAMAAMLFAGQMSRLGYDNKRLIGASFTLMAVGLWMMSKWDLEIGMWQVIGPGIVLGTGLGLCFPILSAAALSCVKPERIGYAASLYNMMRNTGAAIGIAYLANMLVRNQQIHQARLVEHFSVFDAWKISRDWE